MELAIVHGDADEILRDQLGAGEVVRLLASASCISEMACFGPR